MSYVVRVLSVGKTHDVASIPAAVTCPVIILVCLLWLVSLMLPTTCTFWCLFCCPLPVMILLCLLLQSLQFLPVAGFHTVAYTPVVTCVTSYIACLWCFWYVCFWWRPFDCLLLLALLLLVHDPTNKSAVATVLSIAYCGCWHPFCCSHPWWF